MSKQSNRVILRSLKPREILTGVVQPLQREYMVKTVGVQGPSGATSSYVHIQNTPEMQWVINHNLGYYPLVQTYSAGGMDMYGQILRTSLNQVVITFTAPVTGTARLI